MKVISNFTANYPEDPIRFFNFEEFEDRSNDCLLFVGCHPDSTIKDSAEVPKFLFSTEEQYNPEYQNNDPFKTDTYVPYVDKIFTICDSKVTKRQKRQNVFFPFNKSLVPEQTEKIYDVIYTGFANIPHVQELTSIISKFNYRFVSFSNQTGRETDINVSYVDKLKLVSQSKCSIVHNLLSCGTPQLKSRPFESAISKTLMLVLRDEYNVIEEWFTPGEDFIYFDTQEGLEELITETTQNYSNYIHIAENAYNKAINEYSTEKFIEKYIGFKE
jgi:spore maturation protein CgeB